MKIRTAKQWGCPMRHGDYVPSELICAALRRSREQDILRGNQQSLRPVTSAERLVIRQALEREARLVKWADRAGEALALLTIGTLIWWLWTS